MDPARLGRDLRPARARLDARHVRRPGAGRRSRAHRRRNASERCRCCRRSRAAPGPRRGLGARRPCGDRRLRVRHGVDPEGGQDRRPRERPRERGEAPRLPRGRDRSARGAVGGRGPRRGRCRRPDRRAGARRAGRARRGRRLPRGERRRRSRAGAHAGGGARAGAPRSPRERARGARGPRPQRGRRLRRTMVGGPGRRLRDGREPRSPDRRLGTLGRRPRSRDVSEAGHRAAHQRPGARSASDRRSRRSRSSRACRRTQKRSGDESAAGHLRAVLLGAFHGGARAAGRARPLRDRALRREHPSPAAPVGAPGHDRRRARRGLGLRARRATTG